MIDIDEATRIDVLNNGGNGVDIVCDLRLRVAQQVDFSYGVPQEEIERNLKSRLMYEIYGDLIHEIGLIKYEHLKDIPYRGGDYNKIAAKFDALLDKLRGAL
jgi:hypothetical protein